MAGSEESWKNEVVEKLVEVFENKPEDLCRILHFLDEEDKAYKDNVGRPYAPQWRSLKATVRRDEAFRRFAQRLSDDTRRAESDQEFRKRMNQVYEEMMQYSSSEVAIEKFQNLDLNRLRHSTKPQLSGISGLARAWSMIPVESQTSILNFISAIPKIDRTLMTAVNDTVSVVNKYGGTVVMVALAAVYLTYDTIKNISRWWKGEISGKRCVKNIIDTGLTLTAGIGGGMTGAAFGSIYGPIGTLIGGVAGGYLSAAGMECLSDWLTQKLFGIPKDEAVENAYRHLGVAVTATNAEVNTEFRRLCLKHHPDKGGNAEEFHFLQCNMAIIKKARGEL